MRTAILVLALLLSGAVAARQQPNPRQQPGAMVTLFAPEQHDLYDGRFVISANRIHMVGGLNDPPGWDHLGNDATNVRPVSGTVEIDVNEIQNTGKFEARLKIAEGDLVLAMDRWNEFNPCQHGGIVAYVHEHGTDSGCGDNNWPKTFGFLAGWGYGHATLNGKPLYQDYEVHFMVTQGVRDRKTLRVTYPMPNKKLAAGEVNPATQQIDFYIRSPKEDKRTGLPARSSCTFLAWRSSGNNDLERFRRVDAGALGRSFALLFPQHDKQQARGLNRFDCVRNVGGHPHDRPGRRANRDSANRERAGSFEHHDDRFKGRRVFREPLSGGKRK